LNQPTRCERLDLNFQIQNDARLDTKTIKRQAISPTILSALTGMGGMGGRLESMNQGIKKPRWEQKTDPDSGSSQLA
jgi:hypothetical protein